MGRVWRTTSTPTVGTIRALLGGMSRSKALNPVLHRAFCEPVINRQQEEALCARWQNERDQAARRELARRTTRFVIRTARQLQGYTVPLDDLVSEGMIGLLRAMDRYDAAFGVRFMTYADYWVRAAMMARVMNNWSVVSSSHGAFKSKYFFRLRRELAKARALLSDTSAAVASAADALGLSEQRLAAIERDLESPDLSLNAAPTGGGRRVVEDLLTDHRDSMDEFEHGQALRRLLRNVQDVFARLPVRQATILRRRYLEEEPATLRELAAEFGISRERVRQLEAAALAKLRHAVLKNSSAAREELARAA